MKGNETYERAKKRAEAKLGFYVHFGVYIAVILLLVIINLMTSTRTLWFQWPMMGWGIAVVIHALAVFIFPDWPAVTERMIEKEMNKDL